MVLYIQGGLTSFSLVAMAVFALIVASHVFMAVW
jgi:hypothetical protein